MAKGKDLELIKKLKLDQFAKDVLVEIVQKNEDGIRDWLEREAIRALEFAVDFKDRRSERVSKRKDIKEEKVAAEESKQKAIGRSVTSIPAKKFFASFKDGLFDTPEVRSSFMSIPGCYAILTMKSNREKDLAKYKEVYVGCSDNIGLAVYSQLRGYGNIDVYADYKYNQPMIVLIYASEVSQMESEYLALMKDFQAVSSYNSREVIEILDSAE